MKKNETVTLLIEDISSEGLGIGHAESMAVFVKDTVPGDRVRCKIVKMKKTYAFGRLEEILTPGPDRIEPACPIARSCGGCQIQAMLYPAQLLLKQRKVENNLKRIGGFHIEDETVEAPSCPAPKATLGMKEPWHYRNKAQFPIGTDKNGNPVAGFYAGRTHSIIPQGDCLIGIPENQAILDAVLGWMKKFHVPAYNEETRSGIVRHCCIRCGFASGEIMVVLVSAKPKLPHEAELISALTEPKLLGGNRRIVSIMLNHNPDNTNVILGREERCLWGKDTIEDSIGNVRFEISAHSFYQVNPAQTRVLYETALEYAGLTGKETVWDIYCGIGTISLFLAQKAQHVYGIEIVPDAVKNAKRNAELNGITNADFYAGKAEEVLPAFYKERGIRADVIVVDPPRKGCERSVLDTMLQMQPQRIVYVSCDSATLARDLRILSDGGYTIREVQPVDQFPQSVHVEAVCLLTHKD